MDAYEVELELAEPEGFVAIIPAVPGLLILGSSVEEVLERARVALDFHLGRSGGHARRVAIMPRGAARHGHRPATGRT